MTVILDGNRIIGQVLREHSDGIHATVLWRGRKNPEVIVLAEFMTKVIGMD